MVTNIKKNNKHFFQLEAFADKTQGNVINLGPVVEIAKYQKLKFTGSITDINAWDRPLTNQNIEEIVSFCNSSFYQVNPPNVLSWSSFTKNFKSASISTFNVTWNDLCFDAKQAYPQSSTFSMPLNFDAAYQLCDALGGQFPLPNSMNEIYQIFNKSFTAGEKKF